MKFRATEIARAVGGELVGDDVEIDGGVTIDSRSVAGGELFVPILAERNGHEFIGHAVDAGAVAYLTSEPPLSVPARAICVDDTGLALLDLGRHARSRIDVPVIGITGSVGKTTVKDLTAAALGPRYLVAASPRSFNNELGVPLTLANASENVGACVIEMGARGRGHIALLCDVARPTIGVVTTVVLAHGEMFGTVEEVALAKGELVEALPASGAAVLNGDHPLVAPMASRTQARVVTFGVETANLDVTASHITLDDELRPSFQLHSPWGGADVRLPARGAHQVMNALAAAAAALFAGASPQQVADGMAQATMSAWRMDLQRTANGALVLNDAYNANPTSMEAAVRALATLPHGRPGGRRIAIVGVMAELGPTGPAEHVRIAELASDLGIDVIAVGTDLYGVVPVADSDAAFHNVPDLGDGDAVLVKGSRVAGLEALAARLLAER